MSVKRVAPAAMPQLDGDRIAAKASSRSARYSRSASPFLKLGGNCASSAPSLPLTPADRCRAGTRRGRQRSAAPALHAIRRRLRPSGSDRSQPLLEHPRVRELLIQLDRELEIRRRPLGPAARDLGSRLAVERRVHLDGVEVLGVVGELVEPFGVRARRVEDAVPRASSRSGSSSRTCRCEDRATRGRIIGIGDMLTVNEIFYSIQGESTRAGEPCVFVRLTACDLRCSWCDTAYAFYEGQKRSVDDVVAEVEQHRVPAGRNHRRRAAAAGGRLSADGARCSTRPHRDARNRRPSADRPRARRRRQDRGRQVSRQRRSRTKNDWKNLERLSPHDEVKFVVQDRADYEFARDVIVESRSAVASRRRFCCRRCTACSIRGPCRSGCSPTICRRGCSCSCTSHLAPRHARRLIRRSSNRHERRSSC